MNVGAAGARLGMAAGLAMGVVACGHAPPPKASSVAAPSAFASPPPGRAEAVALLVQGVQAEKSGEREGAVRLLKRAIALDGALWEARLDLGILSAAAGDLAAAEAELAEAARLTPDAEDPAIALGEVRRRRGEGKLAADGLAAFVRGHSAALRARTLYVATLREAGQVDRAISEATDVLARAPGDASLLAELALAYLAKGEREAAGLLAKQALDASPGSAVAHRATGMLDLATGDDASAFTEFRKAAQADPHDTTSRINMGVVLLRAGAYAKAEEQYRQILKVAPDDDEASVGLAAALHGQADENHPERLDEAKALLVKVLAADPHHTSALFNLGVLVADGYRRQGDSVVYFKRFLSEAPADHPMRAEAERYVAAALVPTAPAAKAPAAR